MSIDHLNQAFELISLNKRKAYFAGPRPPSLIRAAEETLGIAFPPTYREFLARLGAGNFGSAEFYGVVDSNFASSTVPNGIWYTLDERNGINLPHNLIIIGSTGYGELYCLDTSHKPEASVILFQPGVPADMQKPPLVAEDFGKFFLERIEEQL